MPLEAINITPPTHGKRSVLLELKCSDHAKAQRVFDHINGEILDRGEVTLTITKSRRHIDCLTTRDE